MFNDIIPEGLDEVIHSVLTETDADFLKVLVGGATIGGAIYAAYNIVKYAIDKDKVRDLSELVDSSTGMVEAVTPGKEIKGVLGNIFGSKDK